MALAAIPGGEFPFAWADRGRKKKLTKQSYSAVAAISMLFSVKNYCYCTSALLQRLSLLNTEGCKVLAKR